MVATLPYMESSGTSPGRTTPWWVDGHLDLAMLHLQGHPMALPSADPTAYGVTLPALRQGNVHLVLGTIYTERGAPPDARWGYHPDDAVEGAHRAGVRQLHLYQELERVGHVRIVRTRHDLQEIADRAIAGALPKAADRAGADASAGECSAGSSPPIGIVLLMEGADPIRTTDEAAWWYDQGVRVVGLTWARGSRYAGGNATGTPLTPAGRDLVAALDALGILHDASHLSDAAFDGLCATSDRRVVATHSNARARVDANERHLTDAQAAEIARRDGLVGLNLYGRFLAHGRTATLEDALDHVEHMAGILGHHRVGLGSDFDGGFTPLDCPQGCQRPEELSALTQGLAARGWNREACTGFANANWMRILESVLPE